MLPMNYMKMGSLLKTLPFDSIKLARHHSYHSRILRFLDTTIRTIQKYITLLIKKLTYI